MFVANGYLAGMLDDILAPAARIAPTFGSLAPQPADALLGLIGLYRADMRPTKIDLGVGVYRDDEGNTPVMRSVKAAEAILLAEQHTKSYLGADGDSRFTELLSSIVFGASDAATPRRVGIQTPGGTGALRLGAELIARARAHATVWIGLPSWPNHAAIFREAGLEVRSHRYFDAARAELDFDGMMEDLSNARHGDVVLLHGCCHNPTGASFSPGQWSELLTLIRQRDLLPFIDLAYQGLGDGLDEDAMAMRGLLATVPEGMVAYSCDKNFGLYRDRVGALWVQATRPGEACLVRENILVLARSLWSMPPDHGAAIVRIILDTPALRRDWVGELRMMRNRINGLRLMLAAACPPLAPIAAQRGMFAMLPLDRDAVIALREDHGIYLAESGRINVAGLTGENIRTFAAALATYLGG